MTRTFYRIVKRNPPTREDFVSNAATHPDADVPAVFAPLWGGVSLFDTPKAAGRLVRALPSLGVAVATLELPDDPAQAGPFAVLSDAPTDEADGETDPSPPYYELWATDTGNLLAEFDTEGDALAAVRKMIGRNPRDSASAWALLERDDTNDTTIAAGDDLLKRARLSDTGGSEADE